MEKRAFDLVEGDCYDATPLVELLLERISADDVSELRAFADGARAAAECMWFEVESVERTVYGDRCVVYGHPFNLPANEDTIVEVRDF